MLKQAVNSTLKGLGRTKADSVPSMVEEEAKRASTARAVVSGHERSHYLEESAKLYASGELTLGELLRRLRINVLGRKQDDYAKLVGVSRATISAIERDTDQYTVAVLNKVFLPFRLEVGLVPISSRPRRHG